MNTLLLAIALTSTPELKSTQDNKSYCQFTANFQGSKPDEPPSPIQLTAWGNLASEISQSYKKGDQALVEGSVRINSVERPEGFKEKKAAIVISKIYSLEGIGGIKGNGDNGDRPSTQPVAVPKPQPAQALDDSNLDDIPF